MVTNSCQNWKRNLVHTLPKYHSSPQDFRNQKSNRYTKDFFHVSRLFDCGEFPSKKYSLSRKFLFIGQNFTHTILLQRTGIFYSFLSGITRQRILDCVTFTASISFCANVSSLSCTCKNKIKILNIIFLFLFAKLIEFVCFCSEKIKP